MPRFEFKEGSSSKFWEVDLKDAVLTTRWGRIGTDGQEKTQKFKQPYEARQAYQKQVLEKTKKGYKRVKPKDTAPAPKSNPELEDAILRAPDDADGYLVYADWLQGQGDPRGELIALQHAMSRARGAEVTKLKRKVAALQKEHEGTLLGVGLSAMVGEKALQAGWRWGFIYSARVTSPDYDADADFDIVDTLSMLLQHPSGRLLRDLTLGIPDRDGDADYTRLTKVLTKWPPKALSRLFMGDFLFPDESELSWVRLGNLAPVIQALPHLTELRLRGGDVRLGALELPELQRFTLESAGLPKAAWQSITSAQWPKLEHLEVWFGSENHGGRFRGKDVQPILDATGLPKLKHLGLCNVAFSDSLAPLLAKSKVLKQLETLDLSKGTLMDADAEVLAANAAAFKHLKKLDVSRNQLTSTGIKLIAKLCREVVTARQREVYDDGEGGRYVAIGE
ncbi:Putative cytoplasmic protein [Myxococcus hansupus]|uniref:Putative cytoplasmic protein n=1 Tax=Pseudomyxococcus hansupus TaxID=1297742 RepID=A0A0H4X021_9BACT|nr:WGR domain-containing protein [Myxococcus hansupus]AKQ67208.1 Putative cytoplasmic protein [Myxococcus hansupus]